MQRVFELLKRKEIQLLLLIAVMVVISGGAWAWYQTQIPPEQPILFPHDIHVQFWVQCLYCQLGPQRQASGGLPTQHKRWACHGQLRKYTDPAAPVPLEQWPVELQKLAGYVERDEPIPWVPVYMVPDHAHFNHRPHIAAGFACEQCHGDMSKQKVAELQQTVNMGWCISCHQQNTVDDPEKRIKLIDCGTCHY